MSAGRVGAAPRRSARIERAWLVRAKPKDRESMVGYNRANNVVTIGWGQWTRDAPDAAFDKREVLKNWIEEWCKKNWRPSRDEPDELDTRAALSGIWRFWNKIKVGDLVVLPSDGLPKDKSWFVIGRVTGDWYRIPTHDDGIWHYRPAEWLTPEILRANESLSKLGTRGWTVVELDRNEVNDLLQRYGHLPDSENWSGDEAGVFSDGQLEVPEGAKARVEVNRYERDPDARRRCLEHYDYTCQVCDLKFEERYGEFARGFMHAHHKVPLSQITDHDNHKVNPETDLVAVCPNCHAMLHRHEDDPCDVETLRQEMAKAQK